jgi:hypothetical protein
MTNPMAKRSHTTVTGWTSRMANLVATKDAPQDITANEASIKGKALFFKLTYRSAR